ncbi:quinon protein alcohol dehydrogenase-like superfamily [Cladochytrium replicatum]|nr:quinon protein alcohol dehydrogenase-like superfamily [Cladochytrium replicatum]
MIHTNRTMSSADDLIFVGASGHVHALQKRSGEVAWTVTFKRSNNNPSVIHPHPPTSSLLVSCGPYLQCLSASSGRLKWANPLTGIGGTGYSMVALEPSPTTDMVPAGVSVEVDSTKVVPLSNYVFVGCNRTVRAIRLSDGADLWEFETPLTGSCSSLPALLIEDGMLYVSGNRHVWALDPYKGQTIWQTKIPSGDGYHILSTMRSSALCRPLNFDPSSHSPYEPSKSLLQSVLYACANGYITRIERERGFPELMDQKTCHVPISGAGFTEVHKIPLPSSNTAIVASGANVRLISLESGKALWENGLKGMGFGVVSVLVGGGVAPVENTPSYSSKSTPDAVINATWNDRAFVAVHGKIHAVRVSDGETLWKYRPPFFKRILRPAHLLPDLNGRVYVAGAGKMHCVDAESGTKVWVSKELHGSFATLASYATGNGETNRSSVYLPIIKRTKEDDDRQRAIAAGAAGGSG